MTVTPALATFVDDAPPTTLERHIIGDELAAEMAEQPQYCGEGLRYWHAQDSFQDELAGTPTPGDIHFDLSEFDQGPWWEPDLAVLPAARVPYVLVSQIVQEIFGDLGLPSQPQVSSEIAPVTASLYTLEEFAREFERREAEGS